MLGRCAAPVLRMGWAAAATGAAATTAVAFGGVLVGMPGTASDVGAAVAAAAPAEAPPPGTIEDEITVGSFSSSGLVLRDTVEVKALPDPKVNGVTGALGEISGPKVPVRNVVRLLANPGCCYCLRGNAATPSVYLLRQRRALEAEVFSARPGQYVDQCQSNWRH